MPEQAANFPLRGSALQATRASRKASGPAPGNDPAFPLLLSPRTYSRITEATHWEEIWEAGNYYDRLSELMENACHSIVVLGWQIDSRLPLRVPGTDPPAYEPLKRKLIRLCEEKPGLQIHILMWAHAYFYVLEREHWQSRIWENVHPRIHFIFDNRHPLGASHHEKLCLIDGRVALCGGIDLCDERWDMPHHLYHDPRRSLSRLKENHGPYHDLAVQVSGPICQVIQEHITERWRQISGAPLPFRRPDSQDTPLPPAGIAPSKAHRIYFSRTQAPIDLAPGGNHVIREIEFLYRELIARARKRIILEGQYYWSPEINDLLIRKIHEMRGTRFEITLILADLRFVKSPTRLMSHYELSLLERLVEAANFAGITLRLGNPYSYPPNGVRGSPRPVYVHSKILIIDDDFLSIGSANFAARALRLDSEVNLTFQAMNPEERHHIRSFARSLLTHWNLPASSQSPSDPNPDRDLNPGIELRRLNPSLLLEYRRGLKRWLDPPLPEYTWIPWNRAFDLKMPMFYGLKRWALRNSHARLPRALGLSFIQLIQVFFTLLGTGIALYFTRASISAFPQHSLFSEFLVFALSLVSVWTVPIPFLPLALFACLCFADLNADLAIRLSIVSFWIASLWGYLAMRMFPSRGLLRYPPTRFPSLAERLGERTFPRLLSVVFDPSVSLHLKIISEGLFSMPFAWFAFLNGLVMSSVLYGILELWTRVWIAIAPHPMFEIARGLAPVWIAMVWLVAFRRKIDKSSDAKETSNHLLQHP